MFIEEELKVTGLFHGHDFPSRGIAVYIESFDLVSAVQDNQFDPPEQVAVLVGETGQANGFVNGVGASTVMGVQKVNV
jgi:hypothetical protein